MPLDAFITVSAFPVNVFCRSAPNAIRDENLVTSWEYIQWLYPRGGAGVALPNDCTWCRTLVHTNATKRTCQRLRRETNKWEEERSFRFGFVILMRGLFGPFNVVSS